MVLGGLVVVRLFESLRANCKSVNNHNRNYHASVSWDAVKGSGSSSIFSTLSKLSLG